MSLFDGYVADTGNAAVDDLLSRGGMSSMLVTIWLVISAVVRRRARARRHAAADHPGRDPRGEEHRRADLGGARHLDRHQYRHR
jgi:hypothetical protein